MLENKKPVRRPMQGVEETIKEMRENGDIRTLPDNAIAAWDSLMNQSIREIIPREKERQARSDDLVSKIPLNFSG
jgi:hypothetical protein